MSSNSRNGALHGFIRAHLLSVFGDRQAEEFVWTKGPVLQTIPEFVVVRVAPRRPSDPWIYVSSGASLIETGVRDRFEFAILSPRESPAHVETLAMVAKYHADFPGSVFPGKVVDIGRPWFDEGNMHHLLVSVPYPLGPRFQHLEISDPRLNVSFLWLLPVTADEAAFVREQGVEELERRFEQAGIDCMLPSRKSVLPDQRN